MEILRKFVKMQLINSVLIVIGIAIIIISTSSASVFAQLFGCDPKAIECARKQGGIDMLSSFVSGGLQGLGIAGDQADPEMQQSINKASQLLIQAQQDYDATC